LPAGGGPFQLHNLTVGIFLVDQNHHRLAVGTDITSCIPLRAGEGWILPARASGICEFDETLSYLTLEFPDDLLRETGWDQPDFTPLVGGLDPLLVQMVKNAVATTETSDSLYRQTMSISAAAHLTHVLSPRHVPAISIDDRRLRKAIAYIHDNLMGELSLHAMASEAAMSRYHFVRAFGKALGKSPLQYVIEQRMERAKLLLRTTNTSVAGVAFSVGYEDPSRFGRHFRRHTGLAPGAFRRAH